MGLAMPIVCSTWPTSKQFAPANCLTKIDSFEKNTNAKGGKQVKIKNNERFGFRNLIVLVLHPETFCVIVFMYLEGTFPNLI